MVDSKKRPGKDLDRIDRNILNELQKDGRISNVELSKRVGLSPTPCLERVRRLERQGFIQGYTALLNPHYLDASLLVFVEITLNRGAPDVFEQPCCVCLASMTHGHTLLWKKSSRVIVWLLRRANTEQVQNRRILITLLLIHTATVLG